VAKTGEEEIELVRGGYEAFNRGDLDAVAELLHPDIVWNRVADVETAVQGSQQVRQFMEPEVFSRQRNEIHSIEALGECVLVDGTFHGEGAGSGIEVTQRGFHLWSFRDGKAVEFTYFLDRDEAVRAARA
jgi:ketosteroid isomerase-like protein